MSDSNGPRKETVRITLPPRRSPSGVGRETANIQTPGESASEPPRRVLPPPPPPKAMPPTAAASSGQGNTPDRGSGYACASAIAAGRNRAASTNRTRSANLTSARAATRRGSADSACHAAAAARFAAPPAHQPAEPSAEIGGCGSGELSGFWNAERSAQRDRADHDSTAAGHALGAHGKDGENAAAPNRADAWSPNPARGRGPDAGDFHAVGCRRHAGFRPASHLLDDLRNFRCHFAYPDLELLWFLTYGQFFHRNDHRS